MTKKIVLSGIRPTGRLHIGNYLGALKNFVELQKDYTCYFMIADLHSLNESYDPAIKYRQIIEQAADFIAAGLNPKKCTIFVQSQVHEHSELAIMLSNVVPVSYLFRMTQFKEKSESKQDSVNSGLLYYPVLMASDILLYKPQYIPVGDDQTQHVELSRDIARFFNNRYGETFIEPKPLYTQIPRVMSIMDPSKKMSKSLGVPHVIYLEEEPQIIEKKLARAVTDTGDGKSLGAENLLELTKIFCSKNIYEKLADDQKKSKLMYSELKKALAEAISKYFEDFRKKKKKLLENPKKLESILASGSKKAQSVAKKMLIKAKEKAGILPKNE